MPSPPDYAQLLQATKALGERYHRQAALYVPPSLEALQVRIKQLGNTSRGICFYMRTSSAEHSEELKYLMHLLGEIPSELTTEKEKQWSDIILGALFYHKWCIENSCEHPATRVYAWISDLASTWSGNATVLQSLNTVLGINLHNKVDAKRRMDCCQAYKEYLLKTPNAYLRFQIGDGPDFFIQLKACIEDAEMAAKTLVADNKHLAFIQSIADIWSKKTDKDIHIFSGLLLPLLLGHLKGTQQFTRQKLIDLLSSQPLFSNRIVKMIEWFTPENSIITRGNYENYISELKLAINTNSRDVLFGVYVLILKETQPTSPLFLTLSKAIQAFPSENDTGIPADTQYQMLAALHRYLNLPEANKDFDGNLALGDFKDLQAKVKAETAIAELIAAPAEEDERVYASSAMP